MPIQIQLDKNYYLTSDKQNFQLSVFVGHAKNGQEIWRAEKFAGNINHVLKAWVEQKVRSCDATSFREIKQEMQEIEERLAEIKTELVLEVTEAV